MPATAAFLSAWRASGRKAAVLMRIDVPAAADTAFTVYVSNVLVTTPNGITWEPLIVDANPIIAPGSFGETDVQLCSTRIVLANRKMGWQANHAFGFKSFSDIAYTMHDRQWVGAAATIWLWETSLTNFGDALQVFSGPIQTAEPTPSTVTLTIKQRTNWNVVFPPNQIEPKKYPRAASGSLGTPEPVVYGRMLGAPLPPPHVAPYSEAQRHLELIRRPRGLAQGVVGDIGGGPTGGPKPKIVISGHRIISFSDPNQGTAVWTEVDGEMGRMKVIAGNFIDTDTLVAATLEPENPFQMGIKLGDVASDTTARNPQFLLDPNGISYCELDWGATRRILRIHFGTMPDLGAIFNKTGFICYEATGLTGGALQFSMWQNDSTQDVGSIVSLPATSSGPNFVTTPGPSNLGTWEEYSQASAYLTFTGSPTNGRVKVYFIGAYADGQFRRSISYARGVRKQRGARPLSEPNIPSKSYDRTNPAIGFPQRNPLTPDTQIPVYSSVESDFYYNARGMRDGTPGPLVSSPGALVEKGGDVFAHILDMYGNEGVGGTIEGGIGSFGSYIDANNDLKTWMGQDMLFAGTFTETFDMSAAVVWIAGSAFAWPYINRFTDRWHFVPWKMDRAATYSITFGPREILEPVPEVRLTPYSEIVSGVRCGYGYDAHQRSYRDVVEVGPGRSNSGFDYTNCRDEDLLNQPGVSDTIEFQINALPASTPYYQAVMSDATVMTGDARATAAQTAMRAIPAVGNNVWVGYYGTIVSSTVGNDRLAWNISATNYTGTIPAGVYTMEQLAAAAQTVLNSVGPGGFTVAFNRTNKKFTISRAAVWNIVAASQVTADKLRSAWPALGYWMVDQNSNTQYSSLCPCEEQRFYFSASQMLALRWASGSAGSEASGRQCAALFGFDPRVDSFDSVSLAFMGNSPKSTRESVASTVASLYSVRRQMTRDLRMVQDNPTAREARNRMFDALSRPRARITFTTNYAPDLERGRVITTSGDFNLVMAYPEPGTDGSWANKRFAVIEAEQHLGPLAYYTRITAVSLG